MSAIARSGLVHHHTANILSHTSLASHGMTMNCVSGPMRNAVRGLAIFSIDCPKPNTRPWRSRGTTFCMMVCSAASAIGPTIIQRKNPIAVTIIDDTAVKNILIVHAMSERMRRVFTGFFPSPYRETSIPPMMNPTLVTARSMPQTSTDTSESPYASMSAMNTPPRKLLNIAKNIIAMRPGIERMMRIVPRRSSFLSSSCLSSRCVSGGNRSMNIWTMTASVMMSAMITAVSIPSCPITTHEKADTPVNTSPLMAQIFPLALSRSDSGIRIVTSVERAIMRILPATTPSIMMSIQPQSHGLHILLQVSLGRSASMTAPML